MATERFRTVSMTVDDVLELRELIALADELADHAYQEGMRTLVMRPSRLTAWRHALEFFVTSRDEAEWMREEDREPLSIVRGLKNRRRTKKKNEVSKEKLTIR